MKGSEKSTAELAMTLVTLLALMLAVGFAFSALVTWTIGLFVVYPFTLVNVLKVWLVLIIIRLILGVAK